jgi:DNA-binding response OmpR family regulator
MERTDLAGITVVVVDDSEAVRATSRAALERAGAAVHAFGSVLEAASWLRRERADILVTELCLPDNGWGLLRVAAELGIPTIALTGPERERRRARDAGAWECLAKPFDPPELSRAVARVARRIAQ